MRLLTVAALSICIANSASAQHNDRVAGWSRDVDVFLDALGSQHYVLRRAPLPDSIRQAAARFKSRVARWSDDRALAELMGIARMAGDGHTYVLPFSAQRVTSHWLPLRFYQFSDGLYVIDADPANERFIAARVDAIAGVPAARLTDLLRPYIPRDNESGGMLFAVATLIRFQGFIEAISNRSLRDSVQLTLTVRPSDRPTVQNFSLHPAPALRGMPKLMAPRTVSTPAPLWLTNVPTTFWMEAIGDTVLYAQFNQVQNTPQESLAQAAARLGRTIDQQHPRLLIVDARHNNGGNLMLLDPLIAVLRRFKTGGGRLVVISGRHTFSAAQFFLARAEREAGAEVVGEPSASKPNFVGEENPLMLPYSGAMASVSDEYHESIPGDTRPWIEPKPRIILSSRDYFANRDPVLEAILKP
jgi:hypothetical protein